MKKYVFLLCLVIMIILSLAFKNQTENTFPLFGKLIMIDPGHGNEDPGSIFNNEYEKDYNLDFAFYVKNELEKKGATVIMTREGDYDLSSPNTGSRKRSDFNNRIKLINDSGADLYISLHMNSLTSGKYYGAQAFYSKVNDNNIKLAEVMQKNMNSFFKLDRSIKNIDGDKYMFKRLDVPGILLEYGFISSYKDRKNLKDDNYKRELSKVVVQSINEYFT